MLLAALAGWLFFVPPLQGAGATEYEVKSRVLRVVGNYVSWPTADAREANRPFVLGVLGSSPFQNYLDQFVNGQVIRNRKVSVVYFTRFSEAGVGACDILFVCSSEARNLTKILAACTGKPIFTIADTPGFAERGVMLNLLVGGDTLRLEVNLKAAREAGFEISSAFLSLPKEKARTVETR